MVANWTQVRRTGLAQVGTALLVLAAACGGGGRDGSAVRGSSSSTSSSAPATTTTVAVTTTTLSAEEQVKAAYLEYWEVVDQASDPGDQRLTDVAVEPVLGFVQDAIAQDKATGTVTRRPVDSTLYRHTIESVTITGDDAQLTDCFVDGRVQAAADGSVLNDDVVTKSTSATLVRSKQSWKVSDVRFLSRVEGVSSCDG